MKPNPAIYLVASLLLASCARAESKPEAQVTAQNPVKTIATRWPFECSNPVEGCEGVRRRPSRRAQALVARLRQDEPSWYRYIKAVEVASKAAIVQTGIFVNQAGRDIGAEICRGVLGGKVDAVAVTGIASSPSATGHTAVLATCRDDSFGGRAQVWR